MGKLGNWVSGIRQALWRMRKQDVRERVDECMRDHVEPAVETVRDELAAEGRDATIERGDGWITLRVTNFNGLPLEYTATGRVYREAVVNLASMGGAGEVDGLRCYGRIEVISGGRRREFRLGRCSRPKVERAVRRYYQRFLMDDPEEGV